jgi:hypothetical protein
VDDHASFGSQESAELSLCHAQSFGRALLGVVLFQNASEDAAETSTVHNLHYANLQSLRALDAYSNSSYQYL